jgi:hypothetical protein
MPNLIDKYLGKDINENIPKSILYKGVNKKTMIIDFEGDANSVRKKVKALNKNNPGSYFVGIGSPSSSIGKKFN